MPNDKLKQLEGREVSYKELCQTLGEPVKSGKSKVAQMKEFEKYCDLERVQGTHRYLVREVYADELVELMKSLDSPEQQLLFDAALYESFKANDYKPLYLSNTEMLKLFQEINDNFSYTFNPRQLAAINRNFVYMADMGKVVYRILHKWTARKIDSMDARRLILKKRGFRLYYLQDIDGVEYTMYRNVETGSEMEQRCQRVWVNALKEVHHVDYAMDIDIKWMPEAKWNQFEDKLAELTQQEFAAEGYHHIRSVSILYPMKAEDVDAMLRIVKERIGQIELINAEAKRKILGTTQLDTICTNNQRQEFIQYNMTKNPPRWFKKDRASED